MDLKRIEVTGVVSRSVRNVASKSEHEAIVLNAEGGVTYVLREKNANPFEPGRFESVIGQKINASGMVAEDGMLIVYEWHELH